MTTCTGAADMFPKTSLFCFETKTKLFAVKIKLYPPSVEWRLIFILQITGNIYIKKIFHHSKIEN